ncbi:probable helicase with zinc finger domain [Culex quinquefasciatus]|uniref:probable helicase with zinc finger domain n=1 Tax=Culex quinquefasciatus TaxID=7176 RepID=UPI0018E2EB0D|nr:probable helicase with zinc finger domain [Culex quinquefasciatus]
MKKIADFRISWTPQRQWDASLDPKLNLNQRRRSSPSRRQFRSRCLRSCWLGPLAPGRRTRWRRPSKSCCCSRSRIRPPICISRTTCTRGLEGGGEEAKPLRVYYYKRWVATVNSIVQKYCLIDLNINVRIFRRPTVENILKYRIVVVSLDISMELAWLDLPKGHFTHIFLD